MKKLILSMICAGLMSSGIAFADDSSDTCRKGERCRKATHNKVTKSKPAHKSAKGVRKAADKTVHNKVTNKVRDND